MIKKIVILILGNIKLFFIKIIHFKNFKYNLYNNVNLSSDIELRNKGSISLGKKFIMRKNCRISANGGRIEFGNNSGLNNNCYIVSHELIQIGDNVEIGPNCVIVDHDHDYKKEFNENGKKRYFKKEKIVIGNNVWIGANVVILKGTTIGNNCVIGAGTILKENVECDCVVVQNKNNIKKKYDECG